MVDEPEVMVTAAGGVLMVGLQTVTIVAVLIVTQPPCSKSIQYGVLAVSAGVV